MKILRLEKDVVVVHKKQFFTLHILENEKYVISDFSWNHGILSGSEEVLILYNHNLYYGEWIDANLVLHEVVDYDKLTRDLVKLLPQSDKYFYLITSKFVLTLPKSLLIPLPLVDDPLFARYHMFIN